MNEIDCNRNIWLYRLYVIFGEPLFFGPVLVLAFQKLAGMSIPELFYMESITLIVCVMFDIPSGILADNIGRKKTIVIGRLFLFISTCIFTIMSSTFEAWVGNIFWAIGCSMQSGTDTSFIYDTLKENGREGEYKKIDGQSTGYRILLLAFCSLLAGFLASFNLRLPMYASLPFSFIPLVMSLLIKEPVKIEKYSAKNQFLTLKKGWLFLLQSTEVRFMVGFSALIACISRVWFFAYTPYFEIVKIDITYYGFIFFSLGIVGWLASSNSHKIESFLGEKNCIIAMVLSLGVPLIVMGLFPIQACAYLIISQNATTGFMKPFVGDYMHRHIQTEIRATTMSFRSSFANIASIIILAGFGFSTKQISLPRSLLILGVITIVLGFYSFVIYTKRISQKSVYVN